MIRKFLRQLWDWFFLDLDFEPTHECSACGVAAVWKISHSVYTCGYHYPWGVNRAGILEEGIVAKILHGGLSGTSPQRCGGEED